MDLKEQAIEHIRNSPFKMFEKMVIDMLKPAIRLISTQADSKIGQSKVGGNPDLPKGWDWPTNQENAPLRFYVQINLADVKPYDLENLLPGSGYLYFFVDDFYTKLGVTGTVLHFDGDLHSLESTKNPSNPSEDAGIPLEFQSFYMLPRAVLSDSFSVFNEIEKVDEEYPAPYDDENSEGDLCGYFDILARLIGQGGSHMLGYFEPIQMDDIDSRYQLLLQLFFDDGAGTLYYTIDKQDLKDKQFSNASTAMSFS